MSKIDEAKAILKALGMPAEQQNEMAALTLLALCNIKENAKWSKAERNSLGVSKGIMTFVRDSYGKAYAPNTRETFRRHILHQFVQSSIADYNPDNPNAPVNSPKAHYAISENFLRVVRTYNTRKAIYFIRRELV
jgi:type II restriction enzyme